MQTVSKKTSRIDPGVSYMNHEPKKNGMFTEAITLALIPAIGFGLAWLYERGFCDVHNLPVDWIQLDTTQIISASVKTATILMIFVYFAPAEFGVLI
jgi:hypothetical protein